MIKIGQSRRQKTIVNTVAGIGNRLCNIILSFAMRTVFIYTLGEQYTGVSAVFTDILTMLSLSELGIGTAIATALYSPLKEKNKAQIRKLMTFYKNAYHAIAFFILTVGLILIPFLNYLITDVPDITESIYVIFIFYLIRTVASYLLIYKTTLVEADQKQYKIKGLETVCTISRYIIEIVALVIFRQFMVYLVLEVAGIIIQNVIVTTLGTKDYSYAFDKTDEKLTKEEIIDLFKDIKGLAMYKISGSIGNSIDNILISSVISTTQAGIFSNYTLIKKQIEVLLQQFFKALTPSVGNLATENNSEKQLHAFNRIYYISFIIVNFCSTSLFVLFRPFIYLWLGEEYLLSDFVSFIIAFDFFLYILLQAIASFRTANGLFVKGQYRPLIMSIMNVILSLLLIQKLGIFGTILATSICRILTQWYDPYILFKYSFKGAFRKYYLVYWKYILVFISGALLTYKVVDLVPAGGKLLSLVVNAIACIIIPNLWAVLFTFRTKEFKYCIDLIKNIVKNKASCIL